MKVKIKPGKNNENIINIPSSKSIAHRVIIGASLSEGVSNISNVNYSNDIIATINCMEKLGAKIALKDDSLIVEGINLLDINDKEIIDCNESGSTLRFLIPIFALTDKEVIFTGSKRLMERPLNVYKEIFDKQGLLFKYEDDGLHIKGPLKSDDFIIDGSVSSQFITGLLYALPLLEDDSTLTILEPYESESYINLTVDALNKFNIDLEKENNLFYKIKGSQKYKSNDCTIEGDFSQMSFFSALGQINSIVKIDGLNVNSKQGDKAIIDIIKNMNGNIEEGNIYISKPSNLIGTIVDLKDCPDLGPIVMALATQAKGDTHIINAGRLRIKESDRILAMETELKKLGCNITSSETEVFIKGKTKIKGGITLFGHNDHRIVMALSILATIAENEIVIEDAHAITKSYPNFFKDLIKLGIEVEEYDI